MVPWLLCVYQLITNYVGRKKRIMFLLNEHTAPKTVIVMPCYKEKPDVLLTTIDSIVGCDYPASCMHVFLSFDGDQESEDYFQLLEALGVPLNSVMMENGSYPKSIDIVYRQCRITVSRFPHGGKRHCQKMTFKLIDKVYHEYLKRNDNLFMLFIDSDCILDKYCIQNFMWEMELKPGLEKGKMLAMTGVITSHAEKNSLITILQDMEYVHGQLFERTVESCAGAVTCLPGALTILRFSAFRVMSKEYFADRSDKIEDIFDYGKCHLGEDRWLTHLFMVGARNRYQIQMCTSAFCKTEAVETFKSLLKQRRRWFIGFLTNEVCMLTDWRLWKRYPLLCALRLAQNTIRTTALLFIIMILSLLSTEETITQLPIGFIAVSLGLNWVLMVYLGWKLHRYKVMAYPLMFLVNPVLNWLYMIHGVLTAGQKTWGGPRADAAKADDHITPREAIEMAEQAGDDMNVDPASFRAAVERKKSVKGQQYRPVPLQPDARFEGRFVAPERAEDGLYHLSNGSALTVRGQALHRPHMPFGIRDSTDSFATMDTSVISMYQPRRIESFMSPEDIKKYHRNQREIAEHHPPGGQEIQQQMDEHMRHARQHQPPAFMAAYGKGKESMESVDSLPVMKTRGSERLPPSPNTSGSPASVSGRASPNESPVYSPASSSPRLTPQSTITQTSTHPLLRIPEQLPPSSIPFSQVLRGTRSPLGRQSLMQSAEDLTALPQRGPPSQQHVPTPAPLHPQQSTPQLNVRSQSPSPPNEPANFEVPWPPRNAPWTPPQPSASPQPNEPDPDAAYFGNFTHAEGRATPAQQPSGNDSDAERKRRRRRRLTKDKWNDHH